MIHEYKLELKQIQKFFQLFKYVSPKSKDNTYVRYLYRRNLQFNASSTDYSNLLFTKQVYIRTTIQFL